LISSKFKLFIISSFIGLVHAECSNQIGQSFGGADKDFCIQEEYFNENRIVSFYVSSFDFNTGETDIDFFRYRIVQDYDQINPITTRNLILDYKISIYSPQLGFYSKQNIFEGKLKVLSVDRDVVIHNSDFSIYTDMINGFRVIPQINSFPSQTVMDNMLSTIMQTGKLPDGTYSFTVELSKEINGQLEPMDKIERSIEVYSPVFLELLTPGGSLSDTTDTKIFSTYPVFQWVTDYCPDCNYGIRVCEFSPEKHSSISEALDDVSNIPLTQSIDFFEIGNINSFQYPTSGVIDLNPGSYYAWQIERKFETTVGPESSLSNINVFKIESPGIGSGGGLEVIQTLLGDGKYNELFGPDGELRGFNLYGGSIWINGEEFPANQLNQLASKVQQGILKIKEVEVE
tara:strand:+ start:192 stop:1394 length:1203 start_codon:yes stop_codon:yes gene_type:complete